MEAIMIAGVATLAVAAWYSAVDLLADMGFLIKKSARNRQSGCLLRSACIPAQRRVKQMAGMNV